MIYYTLFYRLFYLFWSIGKLLLLFTKSTVGLYFCLSRRTTKLLVTLIHFSNIHLITSLLLHSDKTNKIHYKIYRLFSF